MTNGEKVEFPAAVPAEAKVNRDLVRLLESALKDAQSGRIVAGGVVCVIGPSQFVAFGAMSVFPAEIIAGAAVLTSDTIIKIRQGPPAGRIMPARSMPGG